jgi:hypothetical protein
MRASRALYVISLFLPAARSTTLNASRSTYGLEIFISLPLVIVNPLSLIHPLIWAYATALFACNIVVVYAPQIRQRVVSGAVPAGLVEVLVLSVVCAASLATPVPRLVGVEIEQLLLGYDCWLLSIVTSIAAIVSRDGSPSLNGRSHREPPR